MAQDGVPRRARAGGDSSSDPLRLGGGGAWSNLRGAERSVWQTQADPAAARSAGAWAGADGGERFRSGATQPERRTNGGGWFA